MKIKLRPNQLVITSFFVSAFQMKKDLDLKKTLCVLLSVDSFKCHIALAFHSEL